MVGRSFEKTEAQYLTENSSTSNPIPQQQGGLLNEGGDLEQIKNVQFLRALYRPRPDGSTVAVCTKCGDPNEGGWAALKAMKGVSLLSSNNNYANISTFYPVEDADFNVKKENFAALHVVVLDDVGTKIPWSRLNGIKPTWVIETSPGNCQLGFGMKDPVTDIERAEALIDAAIDAGFSDKGMSGVSRWYRVPRAINGKEKYRVDGEPFHCRLVKFELEVKYTQEELMDLFSANGVKQEQSPPKVNKPAYPEVATSSQPVIERLKEMGLYKKEIEPGKHDITCPWLDEHTDRIDNGTAYFEPNEEYPKGGFKCHHSHDYDTHDFLRHLGLERPTINIEPGEMVQILTAVGKRLAESSDVFYFGTMMGKIQTTGSGEIEFVPFKISDLTLLLAEVLDWRKYNKDLGWIPSDPPERHVRILFDGSYISEYIPELKGIVRQPYFRKTDGKLVTTPGYDNVSKLYGAFDPEAFQRREPTVEEAKKSLGMLRELLSEFKFVNGKDEEVSLTAMFTAVVRSSIELAPGFHVHASTYGSGKSYLCRLIALFASAAPPEKVSYPKNDEDATKKMLALLLKSPACVEFDDMSYNWKPFTILKQIFTSETVTDRLLGANRTATVSTRSLFLGSGNNVVPERDMLRRILTIYLDPQVETPAGLSYQGDPVADVKSNRGKYVMAVINIIEAWIEAGMPESKLSDIASYDGDWTKYCRQPLGWLGVGDPVESLLEQVNLDPDREALGALLKAWFELFGETPTTTRKVVAALSLYSDDFRTGDTSALEEVLLELPVVDYGKINNHKMGCFIKNNAGKIVNGLKFVKSYADSRVAWKVVKAEVRKP